MAARCAGVRSTRMGVTIGAGGVGGGCVAAGEVAVAVLGGVGDTGQRVGRTRPASDHDKHDNP